ncbi:MAG: hypothetical protein LBC74_11965 [Planctomycetaceae bacterium]|nr:hypothetical protein [Planctomycetaceae bacterium]
MKRLVLLCAAVLLSLQSFGYEIFAQQTVTFINRQKKDICVAIEWTENHGSYRNNSGGDGKGNSTLAWVAIPDKKIITRGWYTIKPNQSQTFRRHNSGRKEGNEIRFALHFDGRVAQISYKKELKGKKNYKEWIHEKYPFDIETFNDKYTKMIVNGKNILSVTQWGQFSINATVDDNFRKNNGLQRVTFFEIPYGTTNIEIDSSFSHY